MDPNDRFREAVDATATDPTRQPLDPQPNPDRDHDHDRERDLDRDRGWAARPLVITALEDPEAAYNHTLAAKITAGAHIVATTTAQWIRLIAEFDERDGASFYFGINGTAHFRCVYCSTGTSTAREHVRVARALPKMPLIGTGRSTNSYCCRTPSR